MPLILIAAVSSNGIIGDSSINKMPWYCSAELKLFKQETMGKPIIMGRVTAEQVGPLPGRRCILLSRNTSLKLNGFDTMSFEEVLDEYNNDTTVEYMVAGGLSIYNLFMKYITSSIISYMKFEANGDIYFPTLTRTREESWETISLTDHDEFVVIKQALVPENKH